MAKTRLVSVLLAAALATASSSGSKQNGRSVQNLTTIDVDWDNVLIASKTSTTLQSVAMPPLLAGSDIRANTLDSLRLVAADYVRFVPWFPYPLLAVCEIDAPVITDTECTTSWNFTYADQLLGDFLESTPGVKHIINFSTTPGWMWVNDNYTYPENASTIDFDYNQGTQLRDPTMKELGDYYKRLVSWYVNGGFTDECGVYHESGHHWDIEFWEVLNEPESEHTLSPELYNQMYDAMTSAIHEVAPQIGFVGLALSTRNVTWIETFLNKTNHPKGTPLDWISYHFYATPPVSSTQDQAATSFAQADDFFTEVDQCEAAKKQFSPDTKTTLDEIGTMDPSATTVVNPGYEIPNEYWAWSGGVYAYVFSNVAKRGVDVVGESQLIGYPGQYPSVSLVDYKTGLPTARLRVLQLLQHSFCPGDNLLMTSTDETKIHAQAFETAQGQKKMLIINKLDQNATVSVDGFDGGRAEVVDVSTGGDEWRTVQVSGTSFEATPYAVIVLTAR